LRLRSLTPPEDATANSNDAGEGNAAPLSLRETIGRFAASRLVQNAGALSLVQAMAYLTPLVTLPYLTRILGAQEWGRLAWAQVILGYFAIVTDWGLSWSGVRKVAALRNDNAALSESFCAGWAVQWALCAAALVVLGGLALYAPFFAPFRAYSLALASAIVAGVLFPSWLLVGLERMREVAVVQLIIRASAVPLILFFVKAPDDGPRVIFATTAAALAGGVGALIWMRSHLALDWRWPRWTTIREIFVESGAMFFSRVWIVLYTSLAPTILGAMDGAAAVGQFVLADKLRAAAQSLLTPVSQALFPRMSYLFAHDRPAALNLLRRSGKLITLVSGATSLALFALAGPIILLAGGRDFVAATVVLRWLAPLPLIIAGSNFFGVQMMLPNRMTRAFNRIYAATGALSLAMIGAWVAWRGAEGAAINMLLSEGFVTAAMGAYLWRKRKSLSAR
jgi:O-antigen/teichoic acid export membrane protein